MEKEKIIEFKYVELLLTYKYLNLLSNTNDLYLSKKYFNPI